MADNLYLSALRTQSLPFRIEEYINYKIIDLANDTLVKAIKHEASLKNMPQRYLNSIHVEFDGNELWIWIDFKGRNNVPLDLFFEKGTRDHKITPNTKKALAFIERGVIGIASGIRRFSKGHWVSGIEAKHIFKNGLQKGYPQFKSRLQTEIQSYLEETSLFGR